MPQRPKTYCTINLRMTLRANTKTRAWEQYNNNAIMEGNMQFEQPDISPTDLTVLLSRG